MLTRPCPPQITLFYNCRPALKTFRSTTSTFFFLVVLLFGWILSLVVMIYGLAVWVLLCTFLSKRSTLMFRYIAIGTILSSPNRIHPSMACGPFRFIPTMWQVVPNSFYNLSKVTQEFLFFIGSQAFSIPLFTLSWWVEFCFLLKLLWLFWPYSSVKAQCPVHLFLQQRGYVLPHRFSLHLWQKCCDAKGAAKIGKWLFLVKSQETCSDCVHYSMFANVLLNKWCVLSLVFRKDMISSFWSSRLRRWKAAASDINTGCMRAKLNVNYEHDQSLTKTLV